MNKFPVEKFTKEEAWYISPFFTNLDKNIFAAKYLPSEVLGALASRYSRSTKGVRRLFFDEYIKPILEPNLEGVDSKSQKEAEVMKKELIAFVDFLHTHGGWEAVVNSKRARSFFARWLAAYGDDSIAQMAGAHLFLEGVSQIATKTLEDFRIGFAPLEKSTRYVAFDTKVLGSWQYFVDPNLAKSSYGAEYLRLSNMLFRRYSESLEPLSKYLRRKFKQEEGQSDRAYRETMNAKAYDVLRAYLPAGTLTNVGFFGVGQAFEYVITKCLASPLSEIREIGKAAQREMMEVIPSMVERATSEKGRIYQKYVAKTEKALEDLAASLGKGQALTSDTQALRPGLNNEKGQTLALDSLGKRFGLSEGGDVELVEWDADAEDRIVASLLYKYSTLSYHQIKEAVLKMKPNQKLSIVKKAIAGRGVRQHRLVRAFENTYYKFDLIANFGCYRDLHRHRMLTQERQRLTTELGFDVPPDLVSAKLEKPYVDAAGKIDKFYRKIKKRYPDQAQYVVMMGHKIRWYQWENLRELAWEAELRTGPQGHPDYRRIEHLKVEAVAKIHPTLVNVLKFVDFNKYDLARRESEMRIDKKLASIK